MKFRKLRSEIAKKTSEIADYLKAHTPIFTELPKFKKSKTVLIVDDDPISNYIHYKLIKKLELTDKLKVVTNGDDGLSYLKQILHKKISEVYPLTIFVDLEMPVMDGIEFIELANFCNFLEKGSAKVIFMCSDDNPIYIKEAIKDKGYKYDYLIKPLTEDHLQNIFQ